MKLQRNIPQNRDELITLATRAYNGGLAIGGDIPLETNIASRILADLNDYAATPGPDTISGKRHLFDEARREVNRAQASRRTALASGRKFCGAAVDVLKGYLGRRWNTEWIAIGFNGASLKIPNNPLPLLIKLGEYFHAHAEHENAAQNVTAARATTLTAAIQATEQSVMTKIQARAEASRAQAAAFKKLTKRLRGLRTELDQVLSRDDARWGRFGFSRPIDSHLPTPVEGLTLTAGLPGQAVVKWNAAVRAIDYRVSYTIQGSTADPLELPLVAGLTVTLSGLTTGTTVVVKVAARNKAGDTLPTEAQIVVP